MIVWRWVVDALALYRLTRLLTADGITVELREAITSWADDAPDSKLREKLAELAECPWCVSVWLALGLVFVVRRRRWWPAMADALAFSALAGLLSHAVET